MPSALGKPVVSEETDPSEGLGITVLPRVREKTSIDALDPEEKKYADSIIHHLGSDDQEVSALAQEHAERLFTRNPGTSWNDLTAYKERKEELGRRTAVGREQDVRVQQLVLHERRTEKEQSDARDAAARQAQGPRVKVDAPVDLGEYMEKDFATQLPWEKGSPDSRWKTFQLMMRAPGNEQSLSAYQVASDDERQSFYDKTMADFSEHPKYAHLFRVMVEPERPKMEIGPLGEEYALGTIPAKYRPLLPPAREKMIADTPELGKSENDPVFMVYYFEAMQKNQKAYMDVARNVSEGVPITKVGRALLRGGLSASYGPITASALIYEGNKHVVKMGEHEDFSEENIKERANEAAHQHLKALALQKGLEGFEPQSMAESIAGFIGFGAAFVFDPLTKMLTKPGQMVFNKSMIKIAEKRAGKSLASTVAERQTIGLLAKTQTAKETFKKIPGQFGKGAAEAAAAGVSYGALTYQEPIFPAKGERLESFMGKVGMDATVFALFGGTIRSSVEALRLASPLFYKTRAFKDIKPKDVASIETKWTKQRELGEELRRAVAKDPKSPEVNRIKSEIDKVHLTKHEANFVEMMMQELKVITDAGGKPNLETMRIDYTVRTPRGWTERVPGLTNLKERSRVDLRQGEVKEPPRTERPVEEVPPQEKPMPPQEPPAPTERPPPLPEEPPPLPQPKQPPAKVEEPNQAALEARVDELFTLRQSLRTAEGSFPAKGTPEREEFDIVQAELKEAKDAAERGDSTDLSLPIRIHSRKQNAEVPEDDMELTAKLIEKIISVAPDAETAIRNVHAQFDFGLGNVRNNNLFNRYVEDRFNPDAPTVGTNKSPFTEWLRVGRGAPAKVEEPPPLPEVKQPPAEERTTIDEDIDELFGKVMPVMEKEFGKENLGHINMERVGGIVSRLKEAEVNGDVAGVQTGLAQLAEALPNAPMLDWTGEMKDAVIDKEAERIFSEIEDEVLLRHINEMYNPVREEGGFMRGATKPGEDVVLLKGGERLIVVNGDVNWAFTTAYRRGLIDKRGNLTDPPAAEAPAVPEVAEAPTIEESDVFTGFDKTEFPWMMTREEFAVAKGFEPSELPSEALTGEAAQQLKELPIIKDVVNPHRAAVEQALAEDNPVPPEVLADYPDLVPPPAQKPELTAEELEVANFLASPQAQKGAAPKDADKKPHAATDTPVNVPPATSNGPKALIKGKPEQGDALYKALDSVTSKDEARYMLGGAHMNKEKQRAEVTDGRSLLIIPAKVSKAGIFYGRKKKGKGGLKGYKVGEEIEGRFPNVDAIIPDLEGFTFDPISVTQLWKTVDGVKKAQRHLDADLLIQLEQGGKKAWFDPQFLWDVATALKKLGYEKVELGLKDAKSPLVLRADGEIAAIIMPVLREGDGGYHRPVSASELAEAGRPVTERPFEPGMAVEKLLEPRRIEAEPKTPNEDPLTGRPLNYHDVRRYLSARLDVPIRLGVNRRNVLGYFRTGAESIRVKFLKDISTIGHETGHYLHWILFSDVDNVIAKIAAGDRKPGSFRASDYRKFDEYHNELVKLGAPTSKKYYTAQEKRLEGVAEFVRIWLTDDAGSTNAVAPKFHEYFEKTIEEKYPEVWDILKTAHDMIERIRKQTDEEIIKSMIISGGKDPAPPMKLMDRIRAGWHTMLTKMFDDVHPIHKLFDDLVKTGMDPKEANLVTSKMVNYVAGAQSISEATINGPMRNLAGDPVGPGYAEVLRGVSDFEEYDMWLVAGRATEYHKKDMLSGIPPDVAARIDAKYRKLFAKNWPKLQKLTGQSLELVRDIVGDEGIRAMKKDWKRWVPFWRNVETVMGRTTPAATGGFVNVGNAIHYTKGSDAEILSPLETILRNLYYLRDLAMRNEVAKLFTEALIKAHRGGALGGDPIVESVTPIQVSAKEAAEMMVNTGMLDLLTQKGKNLPEGMEYGEAVEFLTDYYEKHPAELKIWRAQHSGNDPKKGIYSYWDNGKQLFFHLPDKDIYRSLMLMDRETARKFGEVLKWFGVPQATKLVKGTAVMWNHLFWMPNLVKQEWQALTWSKHGFKPFDGLRQIFHAFKKDDKYQEFMGRGGGMSGFYGSGRDSLKETLRDLLEKRDPAAWRLAKKLINPIRIAEGLTKIGQVTENMTRMAEFERAMERTGDPMAASLAAQEIGLPFAQGGVVSKVANIGSAFFNAGILDFRKFVGEHWNRPGHALWSNVKYFTLPSLLFWWMGKDDDAINKLPDWRKNFFINVNLGRLLGGEDSVWSIPYPFTTGMVYGALPARAFDYIFKDDPQAIESWFHDFLKIAPFALDIKTPGLEGVPIPTAFIPNLLQPTMENMAGPGGHDFWSGRPIVPESLQKRSPSLQWTENTSEVSKWIGRKLNLSPMKIDHYIKGHFTGLGRTTTRAIDELIAVASTQPNAKPWEPVSERWWNPANRFVVPGMEPHRDLDLFYRGARAAEQVVGDFMLAPKALKLDPALREKNRAKYNWYNQERTDRPPGPNNKYRSRLYWILDERKALNDISKTMRNIRVNRGFSAKEKYKRLKRQRIMADNGAVEALKLLHPDDGGKGLPSL